jgi:hypothetical protein
MIFIPVQSVIPNNELNVRMLQNLFFRRDEYIKKHSTTPSYKKNPEQIEKKNKMQEHTHGLQQRNKLPRAAVGSMVSIPPIM